MPKWAMVEESKDALVETGGCFFVTSRQRQRVLDVEQAAENRAKSTPAIFPFDAMKTL